MILEKLTSFSVLYVKKHPLYQLLFSRNLSLKLSSLTGSTSVPSVCSSTSFLPLLSVTHDIHVPRPGDSALFSADSQSCALPDLRAPAPAGSPTAVSSFSPRCCSSGSCAGGSSLLHFRGWCTPWLWFTNYP